MAASKVDFIFELIDKASGPATTISKALGGISNAATKLAGAPLKALGAIGKEIVIGGLRRIGEAGIEMAGSLAAAVPGLLAFKEQSTNALTALLGSAEEAAKFQARILDLAKDLAVSPKDALEGTQALLAAGFKAAEAVEVFKGALDLRALRGADPKALTTILGQIKSKGKLQTEELLQLAESGGLGMDKIMLELSRLRGIDIQAPGGFDKVQKLLESGSIKSAEGIQATLNAIKNLTASNALGDFAKKNTQSLGGLFESIKALPEQFILRADASGAIGPIKKLASELIAAFDPNSPTGQALLTGLSDMAKAIGDTIPVIKDFLIAFKTSFLTSFMNALKPTVELFKGMNDRGIDWIETGKRVGEVIGFMSGLLVAGFIVIGEAVAFVSNHLTAFGIVVGVLAFGALLPFLLILGLVAAAFAIVALSALAVLAILALIALPFVALAAATYLVVKAIFAFVSAFVTAAASSSSLGSAIVNGIWAGMQAAWGTLKAGWNSLIATLPATVATKLRISSPSKVFEDLGMNTIDGFNIGLQSQAANTNGILSATTAAPAVSAASLGGGGGGGGGVNIVVNVQAAKGMSEEDAAAQGRAIGRGLREELSDVLEDLAGSQGLLVGAA